MAQYLQQQPFEEWAAARGWRPYSDTGLWFNPQGEFGLLPEGFQDQWRAELNAQASQYQDTTPNQATVNAPATQNLGLVPLTGPLSPLLAEKYNPYITTTPDGTAALPQEIANLMQLELKKITGTEDNIFDTNWIKPLVLAGVGAGVTGGLGALQGISGNGLINLPSLSEITGGDGGLPDLSGGDGGVTFDPPASYASGQLPLTGGSSSNLLGLAGSEAGAIAGQIPLTGNFGLGAGAGAAGAAAGAGGVLSDLLNTPPGTVNLGNSGGGTVPDVTGAGSGTTPGGFTPPAGGAGAGGATTALGKLLGLSPEAEAALGLAGSLGGAALGVLGANQQADAYRDVANQYLALGAPYRDRLNASYAPGFDLRTADPLFGNALTQSASDAARAVSAQVGNPYGSPGAMAEIQQQVLNRTALPYLANYRGQLGQFGGLGLNTSGAASMQGAGESGGAYDALGFGLSQITQPQNSIEDLLRRLGGGGTGFTLNRGITPP